MAPRLISHSVNFEVRMQRTIIFQNPYKYQNSFICSVLFEFQPLKRSCIFIEYFSTVVKRFSPQLMLHFAFDGYFQISNIYYGITTHRNSKSDLVVSYSPLGDSFSSGVLAKPGSGVM